MNRFQHKFHARRLITACGGLEAAAAALVLRPGCAKRLSEYQSATHDAVMPADVIADLEQFCGQRIYSRPLFEAGPEDGAAAEACAVTGAMEVTEAAGQLQRSLRLASQDGQLTTVERTDALRRIAEARQHLDEVAASIQQGAGR